MSNERDRSIEILLRQRRRDEVSRSPQCLDAEVLAAWMEGGLTGTARADAERHAAGCARCQALLASIARTVPAADARPWWRALSAKWLVPVAAVATALLVWVSVAQSPSPALKSVPPAAASVDSARATAPAPSTPEIQEQKAQSPIQPRLVSEPSILKRETRERQAGAAGGPAQLAEAKAPSQPQRLDALDKTADAINQSAARAGNTADVAPRPAAASPPAAQSLPPAPAQPQKVTSQQQGPPPAPQQQPVTQAAPVQSMAESVAIRSEAASRLSAGRAGEAPAFGALSEIRSPQPEYRWRIVPPSGIQRSVDAGVTWSSVDPVPAKDAARQREPVQMVLTAASSPSRDVCWIVGRAGVVLVTIDGATWQRRSIPEATDLTTVRAVDARSALVTTADGRRFVTSDGGVTWTLSREPPDVEQD